MQEQETGTQRGLANQLIILCVSPDPEPDDAISCINSHCSILESDSRRPETSHLLKMQRWVLRIGFQQFECTVGLFTDGSRQGVVAGPKVW